MYEGSRVKVKVEPRPTSRLSATRLRTCLYSIYASKIYVRLHARKSTRPPFIQVRKERPEKKFRIVSDSNS